MFYGVTASVFSLITTFGQLLLLRILSGDESARFKMKNGLEMDSFKKSFQEKDHSLENVYAVADSLKLYLE